MAQVSSGPKDNVYQLLSLIEKAAKDAISVYERDGHSLPDPFNPLQTPHPLDRYSGPDTLALRQSIRLLEAACGQLCFSLAPPIHTLVNRAMMVQETVALRAASMFHVADILEKEPKGLHVNDIATKANVEPGKLLGILRLLATTGCFTEVEPEVFANNRLSGPLQSSDPVSSLLGSLTGEVMDGAVAHPDAMAHPDFGFSYDFDKTSVMYAKGADFPDGDGNLFKWLQLSGRIERFNRGMIGWSTITGSKALVHGFPWKDLPPGTTLCDMGSGVGAITMAIAKEHPHIHVTLQDIPHVLEQGQKYWRDEYPEAVKADRVKFVPLDFMVKAPVPNQDIYYMKHIMHNRNDEDAITILKYIASVMRKNSRILIHDCILPSLTGKATDAKVDFDEAPSPLLKGYGAGSTRIFAQNLTMHALCNSRERSVSEFDQLARQSGLVLGRVFDLAETSVVEMTLVN